MVNASVSHACEITLDYLSGSSLKDAFLQQPRDLEVKSGTTVLIPCKTTNPKVEVTWCKNDFCTLGKTRDLPSYPRYEITGDRFKGEHHFQIINASLQDIGTYQCQIRPGAKNSGAVSRKSKLIVLRKLSNYYVVILDKPPERVSIDSPLILVENKQSYIVCRSIKSSPEAKLTWNLPLHIKYIAKNDYAQIMNEYLRNSVSNLTVIAERNWNGQEIECIAQTTALNQNIIVKEQIIVNFIPDVRLAIKQQTPIIENTFIKLLCEVNARPSVYQFRYIRWYNGSVMIQNQHGSEMELFILRSMNNNEITCEALNTVGKKNSTLRLDVVYKPSFYEKSNGQSRVINESSVTYHIVDLEKMTTLECLVDSNPRSKISWKFNDQILSGQSQSLLYLKNLKEDQLGSYQCIAYHSRFGQVKRTIKLVQKRPPLIRSEPSRLAHVGHETTLVCIIQAYPRIHQLYWHRDGKYLVEGTSSSGNKYSIDDNRSTDQESIIYSLNIKHVTLNDVGKYNCTAINDYGTTTIQYALEVSDTQTERFLLFGSIFAGLILIILLVILAFVCKRQRTNSSINDSPKVHDDTSDKTVTEWLSSKYTYDDLRNSNEK
ncbi:unnamed protein product, partial [Didymodactylos carnosus]